MSQADPTQPPVLAFIHMKELVDLIKRALL